MDRYIPTYTNLSALNPESGHNPSNDTISYREGYHRGLRQSVVGPTITDSFSSIHPDINNLAYYSMPMLPPAQNPFQSFSTMGRDYGRGNLINMSTPSSTLFSNSPRELVSVTEMSQISPRIPITSNILAHQQVLKSMPSPSGEVHYQLCHTNMTSDTAGMSTSMHAEATHQRCEIRTHSINVDNSVISNQNIGQLHMEQGGKLEDKSCTEENQKEKNKQLHEKVNCVIALSVASEETEQESLREGSDEMRIEQNCTMEHNNSKHIDNKQGANETTEVKQDHYLARANSVLEVFPFICGFCESKFNNIVSYYNHLNSHAELKGEHFHVCSSVIPKDMESTVDDNGIDNEIVNNNLFRCGLCSRTFLSICHLHSHLINKEQVEKYVLDNVLKSATKYDIDTLTDSVTEPVLISSSVDIRKNVTDKPLECLEENIPFTLSKQSQKKKSKSRKTAAVGNKVGRKAGPDHEENLRTLRSAKFQKKTLKTVKQTKRSALSRKNVLEHEEVKHETTTADAHIDSVTNKLLNNLKKTLAADASDNTRAGVSNMKTEVREDDQQEIIENDETGDGDSEDSDSDASDFSDIETFIEMEKHQLKLKKKREYYKERVEQKKHNREKQNKTQNLDIKIANNTKLDILMNDTTFSNNFTNETNNGKQIISQEESETVIDKDIPVYSGNKTEQFHVKKKPGPKPETKLKKAKFDKHGKRIYAGDVMVPCYVCGQMYKKRHLLKHTATHAETRDFDCDMCTKAFKTKSQLHNHKTNHVTERNFVCEHCGKPFKTKGNLRQHRKTHTAPRDIQCPICPEMFNNKYILRAHMCRHSDVKSHICESCGRGFKRADQLTRHRYMHSEDRPYPCSTCSKPFKTRRDQIKHEKIHKPFGFFCHYCNKGFVNSHNMKIHMKTHLEPMS